MAVSAKHDEFNHWWATEGDWVEEPNYRRNGMSGTEDMAGFISIADWYARHAVSPYSDEVRQAMLKAVALAFKKMHSVNRQHGCCYVRHIYVKTEGKAEAGFLDLEKSRRRLRRDKAINHDFRQLEKYLEPIPKADWEQVKAYYYAM